MCLGGPWVFEDHAFRPSERKTVQWHACWPAPCFSNESAFCHTRPGGPGKRVVDLVGAGVVEYFAFSQRRGRPRGAW